MINYGTMYYHARLKGRLILWKRDCIVSSMRERIWTLSKTHECVLYFYFDMLEGVYCKKVQTLKDLKHALQQGLIFFILFDSSICSVHWSFNFLLVFPKGTIHNLFVGVAWNYQKMEWHLINIANAHEHISEIKRSPRPTSTFERKILSCFMTILYHKIDLVGCSIYILFSRKKS